MNRIGAVGLDKDIPDNYSYKTPQHDDLQIPSNWNVRRLLCVPGVHKHQLLTGIRFTELDQDT